MEDGSRQSAPTNACLLHLTNHRRFFEDQRSAEIDLTPSINLNKESSSRNGQSRYENRSLVDWRHFHEISASQCHRQLAGGTRLLLQSIASHQRRRKVSQVGDADQKLLLWVCEVISNSGLAQWLISMTSYHVTAVRVIGKWNTALHPHKCLLWNETSSFSLHAHTIMDYSWIAFVFHTNMPGDKSTTPTFSARRRDCESEASKLVFAHVACVCTMCVYIIDQYENQSIGIC